MSYIAGVCFKIKFNDSTFMYGMNNGKFHNTEGLSKTMLYITCFLPIWHLRHSVTNRLILYIYKDSSFNDRVPFQQPSQ